MSLSPTTDLPHDAAYEQNILAACMFDPDALDLVMPHLSPEMFYRNTHRAAFTAIRELWTDRKPVNTITVARAMNPPLAEAIGGEQGLVELVASTYTSDGIEFFAQQVAELHRRRIQVETGIALANAAWDLNTPQSLAVGKAHDALLKLQTHRLRATSASSEEIIAGEDYSETSFFQRLELFMEDPSASDESNGILTGWGLLDDNGGLRPGQLVIAQGDSSVGKSWVIAWLAWMLWQRGVPVQIVTTEMDREEVMERLIFMEAGVDQLLIRKAGGATPDQRERIRAAIARFLGKHVIITDVGRIPLPVLQAEVVYQCRTRGVQVVLVDHIQHVQVPGLRATDIAFRIDEVVGSLKALAQNEQIAVVAISHISREGAKAPLSKHSGKGGSSIEQDASALLSLTPVKPVGLNTFAPFDSEEEERMFKEQHNYAALKIDTTKRRRGHSPFEFRFIDWRQGGRLVLEQPR